MKSSGKVKQGAREEALGGNTLFQDGGPASWSAFKLIQRRPKGTVRMVGREQGLTGMTRKQRWDIRLQQQNHRVQKSCYKKHWGYTSSKGVPYRSQVRNTDHVRGNITHPCHGYTAKHSFGDNCNRKIETFTPLALQASPSQTACPLSCIESQLLKQWFWVHTWLRKAQIRLKYQPLRSAVRKRLLVQTYFGPLWYVLCGITPDCVIPFL